jgi:MoaA/NifB/PqqE/SkfB family radical SAM enzyme
VHVNEGFTRIRGARFRETMVDPRCPATVDISLTGRCQLRCAWCWGPRHDQPEQFDEHAWELALRRLVHHGTEHVVFTGGEPLISPHLPRMLALAKSLELRVTLSTNAILLASKSLVLNFLDDLGIPIDGSTPAVHDLMRARSDRYGGWAKALDGILLGQRHGVPVTVRTVLTRKNVDDVVEIPAALTRAGIDLAAIRHKLYQVEPIGPHLERTQFPDWEITDDTATAVASAVGERYPELAVTLQLFGDTRGRYFQVEPTGDAYGTDLDGQGWPSSVPYGNLFTDYDRCLNAYRQHNQELRNELQ